LPARLAAVRLLHTSLRDNTCQRLIRRRRGTRIGSTTSESTADFPRGRRVRVPQDQSVGPARTRIEVPDNLKYIRRGRGLTFAKLAECQYVMEVLGDLPLRVAYERLAGMVRMLGEDVQAMALRNAYAIDMLAPDTLTRRRERIAGIRGLSIDTIELYERNMIDELALRLAHGELPVGS
jgi:hypothetical protein